MHPAPRFSFVLLHILAIGFFLSACVYPVTPPAPGTAPTYYFPVQPTVTSLLPVPSGTPKISGLNPSTETPGPLTQTALPPSASPTPSCAAPAGWVSYTVHPGDTLFRLGIKTSVSVEDIQKANCMTSEIIFAGDVMYLPFVPPVDTPVPQPPAANPQQSNPLPQQSNPIPQPSPCPSMLSCPATGLPPYSLAPGGGNDPTFAPCSPSDSNRIQASPLIIELGERIYFFACNFPSPPVSAAVILNDGSIQPAELLDPGTVNRDLITSTVDPSTGTEYKAQAVIEWAAIPQEGSIQPTGIHTLIVTMSDGNKEERKFKVNLPTKNHILVVPHVDAPGTTFQVYYVYYDLNTSPKFELYGETQPSTVRGKHTLTYRGQWTVPITESLPGLSNKGWAQLPLYTAPTDLRAAYAISYNQMEIYTLFWLK